MSAANSATCAPTYSARRRPRRGVDSRPDAVSARRRIDGLGEPQRAHAEIPCPGVRAGRGCRRPGHTATGGRRGSPRRRRRTPGGSARSPIVSASRDRRQPLGPGHRRARPARARRIGPRRRRTQRSKTPVRTPLPAVAQHRFQPGRGEFVPRRQHVDEQRRRRAHAGVGERRRLRPARLGQRIGNGQSRSAVAKAMVAARIRAGRRRSPARRCARSGAMTEASDAPAPRGVALIDDHDRDPRIAHRRPRSRAGGAAYSTRCLAGELAVQARQRLREHEIDVAPDEEGAVGRSARDCSERAARSARRRLCAGVATLVLAPAEGAAAPRDDRHAARAHRGMGLGHVDVWWRRGRLRRRATWRRSVAAAADSGCRGDPCSAVRCRRGTARCAQWAGADSARCPLPPAATAAARRVCASVHDCRRQAGSDRRDAAHSIRPPRRRDRTRETPLLLGRRRDAPDRVRLPTALGPGGLSPSNSTPSGGHPSPVCRRGATRRPVPVTFTTAAVPTGRSRGGAATPTSTRPSTRCSIPASAAFPPDGCCQPGVPTRVAARHRSEFEASAGTTFSRLNFPPIAARPLVAGREAAGSSRRGARQGPRRVGVPARCEIGGDWRRRHDGSRRSAGRRATIGQPADAHADVDALLHHVHHAVEQDQLDLDRGVLADELRDHRRRCSWPNIAGAVTGGRPWDGARADNAASASSTSASTRRHRA